MYRFYKPSHSDFLIHWTGGKDIDKEYDPDWLKKPSSETNKEVTQLYLERLKYVLKFGLWMTKDNKEEIINIEDKEIKRPNPPRTCFTELKISEVRSHASNYGRLGIGFKRPFLFERLGAPMTYYQKSNWFFLPYFSENKFKPSDYFSCFLKEMAVKIPNSTFVYKYYDESEWRIIYSEEMEYQLKQLNREDVINKFKRVSDIKDREFENYLRKSNKKPEYLIPIEGQWFSIIVYPSLTVKVEAESDKEIQNLIDKLTPKKPSNLNFNYSSDQYSIWEKYSKPIGIDLDACRNF